MAVTHIKFTGESGYLNTKHYKNVLKPKYTQEEYDAACKEDINKVRKKYGVQYSRDTVDDIFCTKVEDGYKCERARYSLIGRDIEFSTDKINVIFGPNASGKSTILQTIAAQALCGNEKNFDGFTNLMGYQPSSFWHMRLDRDVTIDDIKMKIGNKAGNDAIVDWDGCPVYYHNYANRRNTGSIEDYMDSCFGGMGEEAYYQCTKHELSAGMQMMRIFENLFDIAEKCPTTEELINITKDQINHVNDCWQKIYQVQLDYINTIYKPGTPHQMTFLLDEVDKSLDLVSTASMFKRVIPMLQKINNSQIIIVTHSPIILSEKICDPDTYNIISMNDDYTNDVKEFLRDSF